MRKTKNLRKTFTKRLLQEAMLMLLDETELNKITVSALCEKAGINRSTFYHHYDCPEDVLNDIARDFLNGVEKNMAKANPCSDEDIIKYMSLLFKHMENYLELARTLFKFDSSGYLADQLITLPSIAMLWEKNGGSNAHDYKNDPAFIAAFYGCYALVKKWLFSEDRAAPEEESALILKLSRKICS